jgi:hypothetical protein
VEARANGRAGGKVNLRLSRAAKLAKGCAMSADNDKSTREERLAAKLRENLRRRKVQTRELRDSGEDGLSKDGPDR